MDLEAVGRAGSADDGARGETPGDAESLVQAVKALGVGVDVAVEKVVCYAPVNALVPEIELHFRGVAVHLLVQLTEKLIHLEAAAKDRQAILNRLGLAGGVGELLVDIPPLHRGEGVPLLAADHQTAHVHDRHKVDDRVHAAQVLKQAETRLVLDQVFIVVDRNWHVPFLLWGR